MKKLLFTVIIFYFSIDSFSQTQTEGCTDIYAKNFDKHATVNNGSCIYKKIRLKPQKIARLDLDIKETSGLFYYKDHLYTHNDSHDNLLYKLDTLGNIVERIKLSTLINKDWEEIQFDEKYVYIADFGNNNDGNRKDLRIYKLEIDSLFTQNQKIDTIHFTYENQVIREGISKSNRTDFDAEAFIVKNDTILIFTKEWKSKYTSCYALPNRSGNFQAKFISRLNVKGLITGASYLPQDNTVVLCGYNKKLKPFLVILNQFETKNVFSGNKRIIKLRLPFHQVEAITHGLNYNFYITNEYFYRKPIIKTEAKLLQIDLSEFIGR